MASSACLRRLRSILLPALAVAAAACGREPVQAPAAAPAVPGPDPGVALPDGRGRDLLLAECLGCHDLGGLELFRAFYGRDDWRTLVQTMVTHGADVDAAEVEVLTDYLARYFGPGS